MHLRAFPNRCHLASTFCYSLPKETEDRQGFQSPRLYAALHLVRGLRTRECYKDSHHSIQGVIYNEYSEAQTVKGHPQKFQITPHLIGVLNASKCEQGAHNKRAISMPIDLLSFAEEVLVREEV